MKLNSCKLILVFIALTALSGCSSSLKKSCESANWYSRGEDIAKKGKFPDSDFFIKKCKAAGVSINHQQLDRGFKSERERVCNPKLAKQVGRDGNKYDFPLCLNYNEADMKSSYKRGLRDYCSPTSARSEGLSLIHI